MMMPFQVGLLAGPLDKILIIPTIISTVSIRAIHVDTPEPSISVILVEPVIHPAVEERFGFLYGFLYHFFLALDGFNFLGELTLEV